MNSGARNQKMKNHTEAKKKIDLDRLNLKMKNISNGKSSNIYQNGSSLIDNTNNGCMNTFGKKYINDCSDSNTIKSECKFPSNGTVQLNGSIKDLHKHTVGNFFR